MTRNSFKRKVIVFGIMIFASIALISTGFAAWIISQNSKATESGNIQVGIVTDNNVKIENIKFVGDNNFIFEPEVKKSDLTENGTKELEKDKVYIYRGEDDLAPNLEVTIVAEITNYKKAESVSLSFQVPEGIKTAAQENYIELPGCVNTAVNLLTTDGESDPKYLYLFQMSGTDESGDYVQFSDATYDSSKKVYIKYTIKFKWGSAFNYQNPSTFFNSMDNSEGDHKQKDWENTNSTTISEFMTKFRDTMVGDTKNAEYSGIYTIVIEAVAKES